MVLSTFPFLQDNTRLVRQGDTLYKVKIKYTSLALKQKPEGLNASSAHQQIEQCFRALLYMNERNVELKPVLTEDFLIRPQKVPWSFPKKYSNYGFHQHGEALKAYDYVFELNVCSREFKSKQLEEKKVTSASPKKFWILDEETGHCSGQKRVKEKSGKVEKESSSPKKFSILNEETEHCSGPKNVEKKSGNIEKESPSPNKKNPLIHVTKEHLKNESLTVGRFGRTKDGQLYRVVHLSPSKTNFVVKGSVRGKKRKSEIDGENLTKEKKNKKHDEASISQDHSPHTKKKDSFHAQKQEHQQRTRNNPSLSTLGVRPRNSVKSPIIFSRSRDIKYRLRDRKGQQKLDVVHGLKKETRSMEHGKTLEKAVEPTAKRIRGKTATSEDTDGEGEKRDLVKKEEGLRRQNVQGTSRVKALRDRAKVSETESESEDSHRVPVVHGLKKETRSMEHGKTLEKAVEPTAKRIRGKTATSEDTDGEGEKRDLVKKKEGLRRQNVQGTSRVKALTDKAKVSETESESEDSHRVPTRVTRQGMGGKNKVYGSERKGCDLRVSINSRKSRTLEVYKSKDDSSDDETSDPAKHENQRHSRRQVRQPERYDAEMIDSHDQHSHPNKGKAQSEFSQEKNSPVQMQHRRKSRTTEESQSSTEESSDSESDNENGQSRPQDRQTRRSLRLEQAAEVHVVSPKVSTVRPVKRANISTDARAGQIPQSRPMTEEQRMAAMRNVRATVSYRDLLASRRDRHAVEEAERAETNKLQQLYRPTVPAQLPRQRGSRTQQGSEGQGSSEDQQRKLKRRSSGLWGAIMDHLVTPTKKYMFGKKE
ncbi:biorientation of chromosomes in cell division protein 1-like 1 isoform X2 [Mya arenaria]|uniref:biorientation of chromosomes in cell division protein 1-like 1 isoform X2 n=1 Tax=Mya arenaria TaxID=6604 RepID=UPI0022E2D302|nr:biorientation of chromosomes in cell division protein 1-like 1 isoform X2 [Mya arenaria]